MINIKHYSGDFFGGLTAAIVALPLALAFGVQSGMGAIAGLYGAIALGFFAAIFGGTKTQISGPTGPMSVVSAAVIAGEVQHYGSLDAALGTIIAIFVLAGFFLILMGLSRIGETIRYMPYSVVSGFMSGIGLIIISLQIFPFFGMLSPSSITQVYLSLGDIMTGFNGQSLILAASTIAIIYLFPRINKSIPSPLVALLSMTVLATLLDFQVTIIDDIPKGFPDVHIGTLLSMDWRHPMLIIIPALTLAALAAIDSLLTSVVADNMTRTQHNPNRELIGQGIGNMVAGIIGGLPGAGATMRTVVNINAGGRSRVSGVIHSLILLIILFGVGAYAKLIPIPVLAGILITVGIGIIDKKGLKHLFDVPRADAVIMLIVIFLTVFVDLLQAVAVGMVMASVLFMKHMGDLAKTRASASTLSDCTAELLEGARTKISPQLANRIYVYNFDGPIFFGFTHHFKTMTRNKPEVDTVIFVLHDVPSLDQSGMYAIEDCIVDLQKQHISTLFVGIQGQPRDMLQNIKLIPDVIPHHQLFKSLSDAIDHIQDQESASVDPTTSMQ